MSNLVFSGNAAYTLNGSSVSITVPRITDNSNGGTSGSVKASLFFFTSPYTGGSQTGYDVADVTNYSNVLSGNGGYYSSETVSEPFVQPPNGVYYPALLLREYTASGYVTDDYVAFPNTVTIGGGGGGGGSGGGGSSGGGNLKFATGSTAAESSSGNVVSITIPRINDIATGGTAGTTKVQLWFFPQAYTGGVQTGTLAAEVTNYTGQLTAGGYYSGETVTVPFTTPPTGNSHAALLLEEYTANGYVTDDYINLTSVGAGSTADGGGGSGPVFHPSSDPNALYRFFDKTTGTQFLTSNTGEASGVFTNLASRYSQEANGFDNASPTDTSAETVYRFFDTKFGTHFYTASQQEYQGLVTKGAPTYRADLTYEPSGNFTEHATQQAGDVPVYRFLETTNGTHFYSGNQAEYAGLTTPGGASYRPDLHYEGIGFYAPVAKAG